MAQWMGVAASPAWPSVRQDRQSSMRPRDQNSNSGRKRRERRKQALLRSNDEPSAANSAGVIRGYVHKALKKT